jgi:hypothetical protein
MGVFLLAVPEDRRAAARISCEVRAFLRHIE